MLSSINSDLAQVIRIDIFLVDMHNFAAMNTACADRFSDLHRARTAISVSELPKQGALVTMNLTAVTIEGTSNNNDFGVSVAAVADRRRLDAFFVMRQENGS